MSAIHEILSGPLAERLGWTLLHFVWQGALVALLAAVLLAALRRRSANALYLAAALALAAMASLPIVTFVGLFAGARFTLPSPTASIESTSSFSSIPPLPDPGVTSGDSTAISNLKSQISNPDVEGARATPDASSAVAAWSARLRAGCKARLTWIVLAWLAGVLALSMRLVGGWFRMRLWMHRHVQTVSGQWLDGMNDLAGRLGVRRSVRLIESALIDIPMTFGWLRPVILMPAGALARLVPEEVKALLAHELAHIRRHDYLVNLLQTAVETLLFYHPAVWWLSHRMRVEREFACDDLAARAVGEPAVYARALARMETLRASLPQSALAATGGPIASRIRRLVAPHAAPPRPRSPWLAGLLVLFLLGLVLGCLQISSAARPQIVTPQPAAGGPEVAWAWGEAKENVKLGIATLIPDRPFASIIHEWRLVRDEGGNGHYERGPGAPVMIRYKVENDSNRALFY